tara:strand:- start:743 stop:856 length:114 start_codon:yes stop_codon:yes gene_type:complete
MWNKKSGDRKGNEFGDKKNKVISNVYNEENYDKYTYP